MQHRADVAFLALASVAFVAAGAGCTASSVDAGAIGRKTQAAKVGPGKAGGTTSPLRTRAATALGSTGFTANGRIHPAGRLASYRFEYAEAASDAPEATPATYPSSTPERRLPPRRTAHYDETWNGLGPGAQPDLDGAAWVAGLAGWLAGLGRWNSLMPHPRGGFENGFVRFTDSQWENDLNHSNGIGPVHLAQYLYSGTLEPGDVKSAALGGGVPDFRDARVELYMRSLDWRPRQEDVFFWVQAEEDPHLAPAESFRRTNWGYTGLPLGKHLFSGQWEKVEYVLENDTNLWSYAGSFGTRPRYVYAPLDTALGHVTDDIFHVIGYARLDREDGVGEIDFDALKISYRNHNLLAGSNGGSLVRAPAAGNSAALTDGWRFGDKRSWVSGPRPTGPIEFEYVLAKPVSVEAIQIHNDPTWPSRDVEVLVAGETGDWRSIGSWVLPDFHRQGPNFLFHLERRTNDAGRYVPLVDMPVRRVLVRVHGGYSAQRWALGEVEVFGSGADMLPDDDWYTVSQDITGLKPATTYHYRLAATIDGQVVTGPDQTFTTPPGSVPEIVTGPVTRLAPGAAVVQGRLNAQGHLTWWRVEYGETSEYGSVAKSGDVYPRREQTPAQVQAMLGGLTPGVTYHYRFVAYLDDGITVVNGEDATFVAQ